MIKRFIGVITILVVACVTACATATSIVDWGVVSTDGGDMLATATSLLAKAWPLFALIVGAMLAKRLFKMFAKG